MQVMALQRKKKTQRPKWVRVVAPWEVEELMDLYERRKASVNANGTGQCVYKLDTKLATKLLSRTRPASHEHTNLAPPDHGSDECLIWQGSTTGSLSKVSIHGQIRMPVRLDKRNQKVLVHRLLHDCCVAPTPFFHSDTGEELVVCHQCHQGSKGLCLRPSHLRLATKKQNSAEMKEDNPHLNQGEKNPNNKLKVADVEFIAKTSLPTSTLALMFDVHDSHIRRILDGVQWAHITGIGTTSEKAPARKKQRRRLSTLDAMSKRYRLLLEEATLATHCFACAHEQYRLVNDKPKPKRVLNRAPEVVQRIASVLGIGNVEAHGKSKHAVVAIRRFIRRSVNSHCGSASGQRWTWSNGLFDRALSFLKSDFACRLSALIIELVCPRQAPLLLPENTSLAAL